MKSPGLQMNFYLIHTLKFEVKPAKIHGEIFASLCQLAEGPSVQTPEIIRHIDASFYLKKSRWDYHKRPHEYRASLL